MHVPPAGELHLQGMDARLGLAVVARDIAALEAAVRHARERRRVANVFNRRGQCWRAACAVMGAQIEVRELSGEEARDARSDRMAIVQHHHRMASSQPGDFARERAVVGLVVFGTALRDGACVRRRMRMIQGVTVEARGRTELGRRLTGVERGARRVAIHVDDGARDRGANSGRTQCVREIIEFINPPVGVAARKPR